MASLIHFWGVLLKRSLKAIAAGACASFFLYCVGCGSNLTQSTTPQQPVAETPSISQVSPQTITAGSQSITLKVTGTNFPTQATILWNGAPLSTTVVNASTLSGTVGSSSLANPGTAQLQVQNTQTMQESIAVPITIAAQNTGSPTPLTISITPLPQAVLGVAYTGTLTATGGTAPYTWSLASGQLPAGLSLAASTGVISGIPTATGSFSFSVSVSDSASAAQSASTTVTLSVTATPVKPSSLMISSSSLPAGTINSAYLASLQAAGGTAPYIWSVTSGLPTGLGISPSTGVISGTPTASGTFNFTATVSDAGNPAQVTSASLSIVIAPITLKILSPSLPSGTQNASYSSMLQASGGSGPYSWSISSGALPAGLTLAANGAVTGTPTAGGNFSFGATVKDSGSPAQTATGNVTLTIIAAGTPLAISSTSLPGGTQNQNYNAALNATGGTAPYTWSLTGSLPPGLALVPGTGIISGSPTASGAVNFTVNVKDSSSPVQTSSLPLSIVIAPPAALTLSALLPPATVGTAYTTSVGASGGTPAYTWSISVGSLPPGLTLAATTGAITGTPTTSGTYNFTAAVQDSGSPVQTNSVASSIVVAAAQPGAQNTWYVRPDGGTRYSSNVPTGQCDGLGDAAYPGSGTNQHCAFNDVRYFWTDNGTYCVDNTSTSNCWYWIGQGGDTFLVRGSIGTGVTYRIGQSGPNSGDWFGLAGNPYGAGIPPLPSGTANAHTKFLGENFASCSAQSARTQLHGGYGVSIVLNMSGSSYVDVACFDITDFSACGRSGQLDSCNTNFPLDDYAGSGIGWSNTSTNDTITDVRAHGLASLGMTGPTGNGVVMTGLDIIGNAGAGWNSDNGNGDQTAIGNGSTLVQNFSIAWNGCAEEYPIVDPLPYQDCTDDNIGGYGDGFGTATVNNTSGGWQVHFDQGIVNNNTQDGLDALHLTGDGSSMTITRVLAYGNMGQQIKIGGSAGTANNNVIFTNCNAMRQAIPGTPAGYDTRLSDFCRAADSGVVMEVNAGATTTFDFNTIYSASATGIEVDCGGTCDGTTLMDFRNNIFLGFLNNTANGYPNGGTGDYSNPIYLGVTTTNPFTNPGSINSNNLTYHWKSDWTCPATWINEVNALCVDPTLTDETWHLYGTGNAIPLPNSPVIGAGVTIPSITIDYTGQTRTNPPNIGAYN